MRLTERTAAFYRALGVDLEHEEHDDGPVHYAAELGPVQLAIYAAESAGRAPTRRAGGGCFAGFYVDALDDTRTTLAGIGSPLLSEHGEMPWGCRIVVADPDGRPVEVNQQAHCSG